MNDEPESKKRKLDPIEVCREAADKFLQALELKQSEINAAQNELFVEVRKVFEITDTIIETDDLEGDDDMLDINFSGTIVRNIKRSFLTRPSFGWSLFSCLFS
jgi:hypothetical protein